MKTERYVLSILCLGVCFWAATMVIGVLGLARYHGPAALLELLEVAAFLGAGLLPLLVVWKAGSKKKALVGIWIVCIAYVTLLALNTLRLGMLTNGGTHLSLWMAIAVMFVRALRPSRRNA